MKKLFGNASRYLAVKLQQAAASILHGSWDVLEAVLNTLLNPHGLCPGLHVLAAIVGSGEMRIGRNCR